MRTLIIPINPEVPEPELIGRCAKMLRDGALVAFPTETVYGLGASLRNQRAMERLIKVKRRREGKPFSIHIADKNKIDEFAINLKPAVYKIIDKFWPGPLTVIVQAKDGGTVGIRMPKNNIALKLLDTAGVPVVAPSANLAGNHPPKDVEEVMRDMNGLIEAVIDGGKVELGVESSIVDLTVEPPQVLRKGAVKEEDIFSEARKKTVLFVCTGNSCRSVMAEFLLKKIMANRPDIEVLGAGISANTGMSPTAETLELLQREGIDAASHTARRLSEIVAKKADIILVMEKLQEDWIKKRVPSAVERLFRLKEFAKMAEAGEDTQIYDPVSRPMWFYEETFKIIKEAVKRVAELI
ncbi:MAG: L-threonylcarbamoyladenylate synthase [Candidatus Omnitrophota bacterium]